MMDTTIKTGCTFHPPALHTRARANVARNAWAAVVYDRAMQAAQPWLEMSDAALWVLMFGPTLRRSWMVWSNGHCPACQRAVPMYTWEIDALRQPWKVRCPHCAELFPKNDFQAFHRSGLDEHAVFDPAHADRTLLFNGEHPDPADPLHRFGVDDGNGYTDGERRWWFTATYLVYGQWKQLVLGGIRHLSVAYALTQDARYAHKAGVLLDRVADLYPSFDFRIEGVMYEGPAHAGYVSTWHDACEETRELALAYDRIFDALQRDDALAAFLDAQARAHGIAQPKTTPAQVCANIERGILHDALAHLDKIQSNYPRTEIADIVIRAVLGGLAQPDRLAPLFDDMLARATAVDGVTGEKGLSAYASFTIQGVALLLALCDRAAPGFLEQMLARHPRLRDMYRFHIDTWVWLPRQDGYAADGYIADGYIAYYPHAGDCGTFAESSNQYVAVEFATDHGIDSAPLSYALAPSMFTFLWRLYTLTGDAAFVQVMYRANGNTVDGLPYDLFAADPAELQRCVRAVIDQHGSVPRAGSVNKQQWHLAILRSRSGAAWLKYDTGGRHGHLDGLNLGLFARGLDLMPDFGYPPVHRGGWSGPNFDWYVGTLSHNTVVVDGAQQAKGAGATTLWVDAPGCRVIRAAAPELIGGGRYERTIAMIDISDDDFYLLDVFRVAGGRDHAWFMHSHFGQIRTQGLVLQPAEAYGHGALMRHFNADPSPMPGWSVDWQIEDRHGYLPAGADVHLRCIGFTSGAQAHVAEAWVSVGDFNRNEEAWIPRLMVRRRAVEGPAAAPLQSTFVAVIEPYAGRPNITGARRVALPLPDTHVCVEVTLTNGRRDLILLADPEATDAAQVAATVRERLGLAVAGEAILAQFALDGATLRVSAWDRHNPNG
ncbi:MAG: heparinase II/III-family protein [Chloroflexi bacterium]|nr:heparinase II/III-family protein [Chloroflexota bacterium]